MFSCLSWPAFTEERFYARFADDRDRLRHAGRTDGRAAGAAGDVAGFAGRSEGSDQVADLRRELQRPAEQPAHANHARERRPARGAVDVPDGHARQLPDDAGRRRRRALRHRLQQQRVGDRRAVRTANLALSPRSARRPETLLRRREPRLRRARRSVVHGDARCASDLARHEDRLPPV